MAGTIPISLCQQFDIYGDPLSGGLIYFFVAGTVSTPQNAYKDIALTLPHPNPITLDASGRCPQLFFSDGLIKIRITSQSGAVVLSADNVQVIGASSGGGGGGGAIDATTVAQTGDIKPRYDMVYIPAGFAAMAAPSVDGSGAPSSPTPTRPCIVSVYLWSAPGIALVVSGGRGATSVADWNANKQITLHTCRGTGVAGLDDMGNSAAGRLTPSYYGSGTVLGFAAGIDHYTQTTNNMPMHAHGAAIYDPTHGHNMLQDGGGVSSASVAKTANTGFVGSATGLLSAGTTISVQGNATGVRVWDKRDARHNFRRRQRVRTPSYKRQWS